MRTGAEPIRTPPALSGLTASEVLRRRQQYGINELNVATRHGFFRMLWDVAREPMVFLLILCGGVYFSFGDVKEALILLASVVLIIGITLFQERKTEHALEALRNLSSPRASVIRDGIAMRIPGREVVPGDVLLLEEGDRIAADGKLLSSSELRVDESLLTGESVAVAKQGEDPVYANTLVVRGRGHALVEKIGLQTEVGKIGHALGSVTPGHSPLRREIQHLVKGLSAVALICCGLTLLIVGYFRGTWREGLLSGLTLAMSLLPEEFPVVLTVFFALGAYRISQQRVLTRRLPAIETLGAANVLCADKTGTMTENRMRVTHYVTAKDAAAHPSDLPFDAMGHELAAVAALACPPDSFDPVDGAALAFGALTPDTLASLRREAPSREYPLSADRPVLAEARRHDDAWFVAAKGAPEAVAQLCRWTTQQRAQLPQYIHTLAADGLRVIAVAKGIYRGPSLPDKLEDVSFEWLGLLGFMDPLRSGVPQAVHECHSAGVQVIMMTGDYPETARVIARQAGLRENACLTGADLETLNDAELRAQLPGTDVFARVTPSHKLRLVEALRHGGAVVAMTGDGVNDAPALKASHIGVAMGGRGTDVAREAADLVVLDDNFVSIVGAIRMGRRIYSNLQKSISYLVSVHVPIAGMAMLPLVFGWPLFFTPIHIVFLELIIDPACSLVFEGEPEDAGIMQRPPRPPNSRLLDSRHMIASVIDGLLVLLAAGGIYAFGLTREAGVKDARTLGFVTLVLGNLVLILINRGRQENFWKMVLNPNGAWLVVMSGSLAALAVTLYVPFLRNLFQFSFLHGHDLAFCGIALAALVTALYVAQLIKNSLKWAGVSEPLPPDRPT